MFTYSLGQRYKKYGKSSHILGFFLYEIKKFKQAELLKQGVAIDSSNPQYEYASFQQMKPEMMSEAIKNAQKTAEQFAEASKSELGQIQTAGQGQFEIEDRDQNTPYIKKLRVVTTITYSLKD